MARSLITSSISLLLIGAALFLPAGTLAWTRAWVFCAVFVAEMLIAIAVLWHVNPEIFSARSRMQPGTQKLDYVFVGIAFAGFLAVFPVSSLDYRYQLAQAPEWLSWVSYVPFSMGFAVATWAQAVNRFFEPGVRLQNDRGQRVIDTGPYAIVRHPGYISGSVLTLSIPLCLGSWWGMLPACVFVLALIPRTLFEERVLSKGLAGYSAYKARVRYRWIPGIW